MVAPAAGAVAELQRGAVGIRPSADRAFVVVGLLPGLAAVGVRPVRRGTRLRLGARAAQLVFEILRQEIRQHIPEEEHKAQKRDQRQKASRRDHLEYGQREIEPREVFHADGDDEKQQHLRVGVSGGKGEQQRVVQAVCRDVHAEQPREIQQQHAGEIEEVKLENADRALQHLPDAVVEEKQNSEHQGAEKAARDVRHEDEGQQPPDLPRQNGVAVV